MIKIKINGQEVEVEKGTTVLQAAEKIGIEIPHFCYHPALEKVGSCRMCQVEFTAPGPPKLGITCRTDVAEGMEIETHSEAAVKARAAVLEFLLANHPLDCPICDKAGECPLQDYTYEHGEAYSRFKEDKRKGLKRTPLGGHIVYDAERCILCTRCVRFMADYAKAAELMVEGRGDTSTINIFPDRPMTSNYTGNLADICPVGALTLEEFRFKVRVWYLDAVASVCPYCSRGCNIHLDVRKNQNRLFRSRPRTNEDVNGYFICNEGRFRPLEAAASENRLTEHLLSGEKSDFEACLEKAAERIKGHDGQLLVVASARRTVEELYLIGKVFRGARLVAPAPEREEPDGILRTGENAPNVKALERFGYEILELDALGDLLADDSTNGLAMLDASIHLDEAMRGTFDFILFMDYVASSVASLADVALPGLAWFEKDGTFINHEGRVQRLRAGLKPPAANLRNDLETLARLHFMVHGEEVPSRAADVFAILAGEHGAFSGLDYAALGEGGAVIREEGGH
jgi:NADH-quinone oxidoreductase subunit G